MPEVFRPSTMQRSTKRASLVPCSANDIQKLGLDYDPKMSLDAFVTSLYGMCNPSSMSVDGDVSDDLVIHIKRPSGSRSVHRQCRSWQGQRHSLNGKTVQERRSTKPEINQAAQKLLRADTSGATTVAEMAKALKSVNVLHNAVEETTAPHMKIVHGLDLQKSKEIAKSVADCADRMLIGSHCIPRFAEWFPKLELYEARMNRYLGELVKVAISALGVQTVAVIHTDKAARKHKLTKVKGENRILDAKISELLSSIGTP